MTSAMRPATLASTSVMTATLNYLFIANRPDLTVWENVALGDEAAARDRDRAELQQRHRVAVGGLDRHGPAAAGHGTAERDRAGGRRAHGGADVGADVDAAVLAGGVRVRAQLERPDDRPVGGPGPGGGSRDDDEERGRGDDRSAEGARHETPPSDGVGNCRPR